MFERIEMNKGKNYIVIKKIQKVPNKGDSN